MAHPGGRPSKLETQRTTRFLEEVRRGLSLEAAAGRAGLNRSTVWRWVAQGKDAKQGGKFHEFFIKYDRACCEAEALLLERLIEVGMTEDPRWIAWTLERRWPERYSLKERHELSGPGGQPIALNATALQQLEVDLSQESRDELVKLQEGIRRLGISRADAKYADFLKQQQAQPNGQASLPARP
jgi:predicted DNA-binding transcriptional regulator AlpA